MPQACSNCGAALIGSKKFCASCGMPANSLATTLPSASNTPPPRPSSVPPAAAPVPTRRSGTPPATSASVPAPAPVTPTGARNTPIPTYPPPSYVSGARVLVQWADGNRYPGLVQQVAPGQCLIVFPDGQQRWVANLYLSVHP